MKARKALSVASLNDILIFRRRRLSFAWFIRKQAKLIIQQIL